MAASELGQLNRELAIEAPEAILSWAMDEFPGSLAMSSSFQTQSLPLLHLVSQVAPDLPVLFLDTGYHFPQTISFRDQVVEAWGLNLVEVRGDKERERAAQAGSIPLYKSDPDTCCHINKVRPMQSFIREFDGWISGIRRDQSRARSNLQVIEVVPDGPVRIHPMANWTGDDVREYIVRHGLPPHPLTAAGYGSIGCWPCTQRPIDDDQRSGRWVGREKTECGLHTTLREGADRD